MKIYVTQDHINRGIPCHGDNCPVALALKEQLPEGIKLLSVDHSCITVIINDKCKFINQPKEVSNFIKNFDNKFLEYAVPFEFVLDI